MGLIDTVGGISAALNNTKKNAEIEKLNKKHEKHLQEIIINELQFYFEEEFAKKEDEAIIFLQASENKLNFESDLFYKLAKKKYSYNISNKITGTSNTIYFEYNANSKKDRRFFISLIDELYDKILKKCYKQYKADKKYQELQETKKTEEEEKEEIKAEKQEQLKSKIKAVAIVIANIIKSLAKIISVILMIFVAIIVALAGDGRKKIR